MTSPVCVRLDRELLAAIDASGKGRSVFIREACRAALGARAPAPKRSDGRDPLGGLSPRRRGDALEVLTSLGDRKSRTMLDLCLGWEAMRVSRALDALLNARLIELRDGFYEKVSG